MGVGGGGKNLSCPEREEYVTFQHQSSLKVDYLESGLEEGKVHGVILWPVCSP